MAKQEQDKTISSVSDIFGFILEQSEKPPDKRRPIDPKTADFQADSEYVSTLVDALALPGTFVGEQTLKTLEGMVDPTFNVKTYRDRIGKAKIRATDLPDFFRNPDEFVDKMFEKNKTISKMQRLQWAGEGMKMLVGTAYAKKSKLFDSYEPEMKATLERALGQSAMHSEQATDKNWILDASEKLYTNGELGRKKSQLEARIETETNPAIKQKLEQRLGKLNETYGTVMNNPKKTYEGFRDLLGTEFDLKNEKLLNGRKPEELSEEEYTEYSKLKRAKNVVGLWGLYDGLPQNEKSLSSKKEELTRKQKFAIKRKKLTEKKRTLLEQKEALKKGGSFSLDGKTIDYSQLSSHQRKVELRNIEDMVRDIDDATKSLSGVRFWSDVGQLEGVYHGLKQTLGPGGLEAVLNGDFFDKNKGYFGCPSEEVPIELKNNNGFEFEVKFVKAQVIEGRKGVNKYNEIMTNIYYLNPTTLLKTVATGERFAWMAHKKQKELKDLFGIKEDSGVLAGVLDPEFWSFFSTYQNLDPDAQALFLANPNNAKYSVLLDKVVKGMQNSTIAKKILKAQRLSEQYKKLSQWAYVFSTPERILSAIQDGTIGKIQKNLRNGTVKFLSKMKIFSENKAALKLLQSWGAKGGGKALTSAISTAVVKALGLAASSVAGPVGWVVSLAVSFALEKVAKLAIKVVIFGLAGVVGFVVLIGGVKIKSDQTETDAYSREVPGEINYNEEFEGFGGSGEDTDYDYPPMDVPPPTNSTCPFGEATYYCNQGFTNTTCTHKDDPNFPVDLGPVTYFYAPQYCDDSTCTATTVVDPGRCADGAYTGQWVTFNDGNGNSFILGHSKIIEPSSGSSYKGGEPVAYFYQSPIELAADDPLQQTVLDKDNPGLTDFNCWTGNHVHLKISHNGGAIDPIPFLHAMGCNGPSSESECPPCESSDYEEEENE